MSAQSVGSKLQSLPKFWLYLILFATCTLPLFMGATVPNEPSDDSIAFYANVMKMPEGSVVLLASDWTGSTRGESSGQFDSIVRILMRHKIKFALFSTADPQAPRVAQDSIARLTAEHEKAGGEKFERWKDWVNVGFFPNSESAMNGIANDLKSLFSSRKDISTSGSPTNVMQSPVLAGKSKIQDFAMLILTTASKTSDITVERCYGKIPLAFAVTGVMGPETKVYYTSAQIVGLANGLKGAYDLETLMEKGTNYKGEQIEGFPGKPNTGKGYKYYPTLHFAAALLIIMIILGNVGMLLSKKRGSK